MAISKISKEDIMFKSLTILLFKALHAIKCNFTSIKSKLLNTQPFLNIYQCMEKANDSCNLLEAQDDFYKLL